MLAARVEFLEMELNWVRAIRKGCRADLASQALERETQILIQLTELRRRVATAESIHSKARKGQ